MIEAGTHTNCRDDQRMLPEERTEHIQLKEYLHSKRSILLKCQCAHLIISSGNNYDLYLRENLKNFILIHQGK